jgi:hypothetical protein
VARRNGDEALFDAAALAAIAVALAGGRPVDLARELGTHGIDQMHLARRLGRWLNGENAPEYAPTLAMLLVAGWLDPAAIRRAGSPQAEALAVLAEEALLRAAAHRADEQRPPQRKRETG